MGEHVGEVRSAADETSIERRTLIINGGFAFCGNCGLDVDYRQAVHDSDQAGLRTCGMEWEFVSANTTVGLRMAHALRPDLAVHVSAEGEYDNVWLAMQGLELQAKR